MVCTPTSKPWSRRHLSEVLCGEWDWRNGAGRLKDMATRTLLLKLEARGPIQLPPRRLRTVSRMRLVRTLPLVWEEQSVARLPAVRLGGLEVPGQERLHRLVRPAETAASAPRHPKPLGPQRNSNWGFCGLKGRMRFLVDNQLPDEAGSLRSVRLTH